MKKRYITALIFAVLLTLSGCTSNYTSNTASTSDPQTDKTAAGSTASTADKSQTVNTNLSSSAGYADMFSDNDMEIGYDEETSAKITLSGTAAACNSNAVQINGGRVTITDEGTYIISGTLDDGMIIVNVKDTEKVRLVLNGVQIKSSASAAIYVAEADKVFITTVSGSENILSNGGEYKAIDENNIDSVVFSKSDLTLNGEGTLTVNAAAGHGIVSKDDLVLTGGTYNITAQNHGLSGKDSVRISNGAYNITSGKDGIHSENTDDEEKGYIYISGGSFTITADGDGISAEEYLTVLDGDFTITTGEGSESVTMPVETMGFGQKGSFFNETSVSEADDSVSTKGFKTDGALTVAKGSFTTDTEDDSFHAGGNILISGGSFEIKTGDDGVHSDADVMIQNGDFYIPYCYEGIEGLTVTVDNGTFDITAYDDGFNAAGGSDNSGFGGGRPGQDVFSSSSDSYIIVNGGTITVVSDGDCLDSNGALTINGGILNLTCNGNGNTALDCDGAYTYNGGSITTNDGSEANPNQMPGGMGGHGGMGNPEGMGGHSVNKGGINPHGGIGSMTHPEGMEPTEEMDKR